MILVLFESLNNLIKRIPFFNFEPEVPAISGSIVKIIQLTVNRDFNTLYKIS